LAGIPTFDWSMSDEELHDLVVKAGTREAAAAQIGCARTTLAHQLNKRGILAENTARLAAARRPAGSGPADPAAEVSREEILTAEVKELRSKLNKARKLDVAQERVLLAVERAIENANVTLLSAPRPPAPAKSDAHHRQAAVLSDWHGGEVVLPAEVGGLNEFNWTILEQRVEEIGDSLLGFKRVRPPLTGLDLWFLGDMVSGNIHDELSQTNEFPVAEQSVKAGQLMATLVSRLAPHYPELHCVGIPGNHARTQKPHASKRVFDSWDWTAYQFAAAATGHHKNVTWDIPPAGTVVRTVAGMNFLLWHGDGVRSSMPGVPAGGVARRTNELRKQYAEIGIKLDGLVCGHFHSANMWAGNVFVNGSLIGTNEFGAKNFGGGERPKQLLLTIDAKRRRLTDVAFLTPSAGVPAAV
jgi:hypothetical protein